MRNDVADGINYTINQQNALPHLFLVARTLTTETRNSQKSEPSGKIIRALQYKNQSRPLGKSDGSDFWVVIRNCRRCINRQACDVSSPYADVGF